MGDRESLSEPEDVVARIARCYGVNVDVLWRLLAVGGGDGPIARCARERVALAPTWTTDKLTT